MENNHSDKPTKGNWNSNAPHHCSLFFVWNWWNQSQFSSVKAMPMISKQLPGKLAFRLSLHLGSGQSEVCVLAFSSSVYCWIDNKGHSTHFCCKVFRENRTHYVRVRWNLTFTRIEGNTIWETIIFEFVGRWYSWRWLASSCSYKAVFREVSFVVK